MNKFILGFLVTVSALLTCTAALATNVWKNSMEVTGVMNTADGGFIIQGPAGIAPECNGGNGFNVRANQNSLTIDGVKAALAIALSAFSIGKPVTLLYDNANSTCYVQIVQITS